MQVKTDFVNVILKQEYGPSVSFLVLLKIMIMDNANDHIV